MVKYTLKHWLDGYPSFYLKVLSWKRRRHWSKNWIVRPDTEVVIEGFPRSGNSFAYSAFKQSNPSVRKIATHLHMSSQVVMAVRYGRPCMVLIRDPIDAVCSMLALSHQIGDRRIHESDNRAAMQRLLISYHCFYQRIQPCLSGFVIAPFEIVTHDYGRVITAMNHRFGSTFRCFKHDDESANDIINNAPIHLGPSEERDRLKSILLQQLHQGRLDKSIEQAKATYCFYKKQVVDL